MRPIIQLTICHWTKYMWSNQIMVNTFESITKSWKKENDEIRSNVESDGLSKSRTGRRRFHWNTKATPGPSFRIRYKHRTITRREEIGFLNVVLLSFPFHQTSTPKLQISIKQKCRLKGRMSQLKTIRRLEVVSPVPADIDIANSVTPFHISEIASGLNLSPKHYDLYGKYKAKVGFPSLATSSFTQICILMSFSLFSSYSYLAGASVCRR